MKGLSDEKRNEIIREVNDVFLEFVATLNELNPEAWASYYSDDFLSAIVNTDHYGARGDWIGEIKKYFASRESQRVDPVFVNVSALGEGLAMTTSEEKTDMTLKDGGRLKAKHLFSIVWRREAGGWRILHSHESWTEA